MNKSTHIISELKGFFTEKNNGKAIQSIMKVMEHIVVKPRQMGCEKNANCKCTFSQVLDLMVLFPFFALKNAAGYAGSVLGSIFTCKKEMFYRFMSNDDINWRQVGYSIARRLINRIAMRSDSVKSTDPVCIVADDTDFPKTGRHGELLGRIYSHVQNSSILGYKGLFLMRTDGKTQTMLDASLHGEEGKNKQKKQGLTQKQIDARYSKEREQDSRAQKRVDEYFASKLDNLIKMIKRALLEGIRFDYLLVDSWFTCKELVSFIRSRHFGCHMIGMIKMSRTKYGTPNGEMTANTIIASLEKSKSVKYSRKHKFYYASIEVSFAGAPAKLFFYRYGKKGQWNALLSTNTALDAYQAYKIYSMRWSIEVAFHECKSLLNLGKCQCRDFSSQIASMTLVMIQYNILGYVKRYESYETMGGLFKELSAASAELSVTEKIWGIILEIVNTVAGLFSCNQEEVLKTIINDNNNNELRAVMRACQALQLAA